MPSSQTRNTVCNYLRKLRILSASLWQRHYSKYAADRRKGAAQPIMTLNCQRRLEGQYAKGDIHLYILQEAIKILYEISLIMILIGARNRYLIEFLLSLWQFSHYIYILYLKTFFYLDLILKFFAIYFKDFYLKIQILQK